MANIHPTAIIEAGAAIDESAEIGAYAVIGAKVKIGAGTIVQPHACIRGNTTIGRDCKIFSFACVGFPTQDLKYDGGETYAEIGDGTTLREFSTVHCGTRDGEVTRVGKNCLIMAYCHVAHGCRVGNGVIMSNSVQLAGEVEVEDMAIIGGLAGVHQFCRIGTMAMVGGASKIAKDVPPYMLVGDNPTNVVGINLVGLQRRGVPPEVRSALKAAFKILYREGLNRTQAIERIRSDIPDSNEIRHLTSFIEQSSRGTL